MLCYARLNYTFLCLAKVRYASLLQIHHDDNFVRIEGFAFCRQIPFGLKWLRLCGSVPILRVLVPWPHSSVSVACLLVSFNVFLLFSLQHHLSHILSLHPLVDTLCVTNSPMLCNEHKRVAPVHAACVCLASNSTCQLRISNPAYINILLGRPGFGRELFM